MRVIAKRAVTSSKEQSVEPNAAPVIDSAAAAAGGGTVLHLDARYGVTTDATGKVSIWADQSPSSNNFVQNISALQPVLTSDTNGVPVINFDLLRRGAEMHGTPTDHRGKTVVYIYNNTIAPVENIQQTPLSMGDYTAKTLNGVAGIYNYGIDYMDNINPPLVYSYVDSVNGAYIYIPNRVFTSSTNMITLDVSNSFPVLRRYKNGNMDIATSTATTTSNTPLGLFYLGLTLQGNRYNPIDFYEVIVFDRILTQTETDAMAAYVTANYGAL